jgi:hypothetical protein
MMDMRNVKLNCSKTDRAGAAYVRPPNPGKAGVFVAARRMPAVDHASRGYGISPGDEKRGSTERFTVRRRDGRASLWRYSP